MRSNGVEPHGWDARLSSPGSPVCTPDWLGLREAADAAARELEELGARRLRPYLCARSRHGHFHLATDTSRPLHERVPQQRRPA